MTGLLTVRIVMETWIALFAGIGLAALWYGRKQPFPIHGRNFASACLLCAGLLSIARAGPRPTEAEVPMAMAMVVGFLATWHGSRLMTRWKRDVIVAPLGSILLACGAIAMLSRDWSNQSTVQQVGGFVLASALVTLVMYLCFRGLVIGIPGIAWSQAGLIQLERGLIEGPRGAIICFERAWSEEDPALDAMSQAALCRIHAAGGGGADTALTSAERRLRQHGGWEAVDTEWIEAIDSALRASGMRPVPMRVGAVASGESE